jgi:hypothetical protein
VCVLCHQVTSTSAMLRCSHFVKKSIQGVQTWSNSNSMHINVRHKTEQRFIAFLISYASCTCVRYVNRYFVTNFQCGRENVPCARCCATPISSRNRFKPYKLDRIATACILMCATRQNSVSFRFWEVTHHAHVCGMSIGILLQIFSVGGKTCHVRDVARLSFRQEIDSSRTNLIE